MRLITGQPAGQALAQLAILRTLLDLQQPIQSYIYWVAVISGHCR
ncbi:MAG: hypothetical protein ACLGID_15060 [Gammaproteobacteria bacterium]|nr:hypothetical protein [Pseudomonas sp. 9AZ]